MATLLRGVIHGRTIELAHDAGFPEGQVVAVSVQPIDASITAPAGTESEIVRRIQACTTYHEWLDVVKSLPPDDGGYDIAKSLDENRRWSGDRPILPNGGQRP